MPCDIGGSRSLEGSMTRTPRRLVAVAPFVAVIVPLAAAGGEAPDLVVTRLSARTMVLHGTQPGAPRMTVFASDKGLVVFDTLGTPSEAAAARARIEREFGRKDFLLVVNTHDHWDHWCGNQVFSGVAIVSHESAPAEMKRPLESGSHPAPSLKPTIDSWRKQLAGLEPSSEKAGDLMKRIAYFQRAFDDLGRGFTPTLPGVTFSDRMAIDLGPHTLKLHFTGGYETPDDIIAEIPEEGLIVLGDTFQRGQYFAGFANGIDVPRWTAILDDVLAGQVRYAVPGHGGPLSKAELAEIGTYLKLSWSAVEAVVREGLAGDRAEGLLSFETMKRRLDPALIDFSSLEAVHPANVEALRRRLLGTRSKEAGKG